MPCTWTGGAIKTYRDNHQFLLQSTIFTCLHAIKLKIHNAHVVIEIHCHKAMRAYPNGSKRQWEKKILERPMVLTAHAEITKRAMNR